MRMSTGSELLKQMTGAQPGNLMTLEMLVFYDYAAHQQKVAEGEQSELGDAWCCLVLTENGEMYRAFSDSSYKDGFVYEALFDDNGKVVGGRCLPDTPTHFAILTTRRGSLESE